MSSVVLSNTNVDPITNSLNKHHSFIKLPGYGNWFESIINKKSILHQDEVANIFIIMDGSELVSQIKNNPEYEKIIDNYFSSIDTFLRLNPTKKIYLSNVNVSQKFVSNLDDLNEYEIVNKWERNLIEFCSKNENLKILDINRLIKKTGEQFFYDNKLWYLAGIKYSKMAVKIISDFIEKILFFSQSARKKCLILDLDNTLWGGVLGELGPEKIQLSKTGPYSAFRDFQIEIKRIKETGILLAIASKNEFKNVEKAFKENDNMILSLDDFVSVKANWGPKSNSIKELKEELNISFESMVFIDDNPFEREEVKKTLNEVIVPEFPGRVVDLPDFASRLFDEYFFIETLTDSDKKKTTQTKSLISFNTEKRNYENIDDYLNSLDLSIEISINNTKKTERITQIINKTNQFNLTLNRFSKNELQGFIDKKNLVVTGKIKDKFGDQGLSILSMIEIDNYKAKIVNYLMSCRIMGRKIEYRFFEELICILDKRNITTIEATFTKSEKNSLVSNFYHKIGFDLVFDDEKISTYSASIDQLIPREKQLNYRIIFE